MKRQMRENLRKYQRPLHVSGFLRVKGLGFHVAEHPARTAVVPHPTLAIRSPGPREGLHQPKLHMLNVPSVPVGPSHTRRRVVAMDEAVGTSPPSGGRLIASSVLSIRGSVGEIKRTSGMIRLDASSESLPYDCTKEPRDSSTLRHNLLVQAISHGQPFEVVGRQ